MLQSYRILSGSMLKVIAMVTMLVDHLAAYYWWYDPQFAQPFFTIGHHQVDACFLMRLVGRIAFPIFAFLLVEGFVHTSNRRRYGISLFLLPFQEQFIICKI